MKRREIGSEFYISNNLLKEKTGNIQNVFCYLREYNTSFFDSGRSALYALRTILKSQKVLLPDYICESVRNCFPESMVIYYHIDENFQIDWEDLLSKCTKEIDILYLYFFNGYIGKNYNLKKLIELKKQMKFLVVEDTTHSFLTCTQTVGDYCICSLRKWFPIPDGGVLYSRNLLPLEKYSTNQWAEKKADAMRNKGYYFEGHNVKKSDFLTIFAKTEQMLDKQMKPHSISEISVNILQHIDVTDIARIRCRNYAILNNRLPFRKIATEGEGQVPLFFATCLDNRDLLRKYLIEKCIYCPVHWPLFDELEQIEGSVFKYNKELSIPIDQRYNSKDMEYIVETIIKFVEIYDDRYKEK